MEMNIGGIPHPFQDDAKCELNRDVELPRDYLREALSSTAIYVRYD